MRWKGLLTVIIILGILGFLFITPTSRDYADFFKSNIVKFVPALTALLGTKPSGNYFTVILSADKTAFYGQSYQVENSSLTAYGICRGTVTLDSVVLEKSTRCEIKLDNANGKFEYTSAGSIRGTLSVTRAVIDDVVFSPADPAKGLKVEFDALPIEFLLTGLNENRVSLSKVNGEIKKLKEDGSIDQVKNLKDEQVEITNFLGNIRLSGDTVTLSGFATKVNWFT